MHLNPIFNAFWRIPESWNQAEAWEVPPMWYKWKISFKQNSSVLLSHWLLSPRLSVELLASTDVCERGMRYPRGQSSGGAEDGGRGYLGREGFQELQQVEVGVLNGHGGSTDDAVQRPLGHVHQVHQPHLHIALRLHWLLQLKSGHIINRLQQLKSHSHFSTEKILFLLLLIVQFITRQMKYSIHSYQNGPASSSIHHTTDQILCVLLLIVQSVSWAYSTDQISFVLLLTVQFESWAFQQETG